MTLLELWRARGRPAARTSIPGRSRPSSRGRLVRILSLPVLPLMAIPLAIGRVRGQRSYGLVVGLAVLIAFHQVVQVGEALVDNGDVAGLARPVAAVRRLRAGLAGPVRARRHPRARPAARLLARPAARPARPPAAAPPALRRRPRMSVLAGYLNRMFLVRFLVVLFGDHRLRHRGRPARRRPRIWCRRPRAPCRRAALFRRCGCRSCSPS